jgi:prenyltransferase beta subunit
MKRTAAAVVVLLFVALPVWGQTADQKKATVEYLKKLQNKDGGFAPAEGQAKSSLGATNGALRALKYSGGEVADKTACIDFVKSCFDKTTGGFADQPGGKPTVSLTAVGLMALVELKVDPEPYKAPALSYLDQNAKTFEEVRIAAAGLEAVDPEPRNKAWFEVVTKLRNEDGTFGKGDGQARDTGSAAVALLRLGGKVDKDAVLKAMNSGQRKDGGFGTADAKESDLGTTYRVLRAYHMLKAKPDADKLRGFIDACRNKDGGYGVSPGKPSTVSATYNAAIIQHWLDEK